jgi:hypothetical protein
MRERVIELTDNGSEAEEVARLSRQEIIWLHWECKMKSYKFMG